MCPSDSSGVELQACQKVLVCFSEFWCVLQACHKVLVCRVRLGFNTDSRRKRVGATFKVKKEPG